MDIDFLIGNSHYATTAQIMELGFRVWAASQTEFNSLASY